MVPGAQADVHDLSKFDDDNLDSEDEPIVQRKSVPEEDGDNAATAEADAAEDKQQALDLQP